jgi:nucleotide-binding universal stress UspA family protein
LAQHSREVGIADGTRGGVARDETGHRGKTAPQKGEREKMRLRDLLVVVDRFANSSARIEVAASLARQHDAHLAALFVLPISEPRGRPARTLVDEMIEHYIREAEEHAREARQQFEAAAQRHGIQGEWRTDGGIGATEVSKHARYADLVLVGPRDLTARTPPMPPLLPEEVALSAGRPVLVVPGGTEHQIGKSIVIAWNASREATRAVNDALPMLAKADGVTVVVINPDTKLISAHGEQPGADIALHLARHGIRVDVECVSTRDTEAAALLATALKVSADLIVMGAYGHSRVRELVLGGVTRDLLAQSTMPILMSHYPRSRCKKLGRSDVARGKRKKPDAHRRAGRAP